MDTGAVGSNPRYVNNGDSITKEEKGGFASSFISVGQAFKSPFADYLNVTFDKELLGLVASDVLKFLDVLGSSEVTPGTYHLSGGRGVVKVHSRGKVGVVSASGGVLEQLRVSGLFGEYLGVLGAYPHRVSMLHVTQDFAVPSPPATFREVRRRAYAGELQLSRKSLHPGAVRCYSSLRSMGEETGTVYLGNRASADVWCKVYDKQHERLEAGFPDPGPLVRVEIAVQSGVGATLRDAFSPASLFWHFGQRLLGSRPVGVPSWSAHGEGFVLSERRFSPGFSQRVQGLLSGSLDIQRLVDLARAEVVSQAIARGEVCTVASPELVWELLMPELRARCRLQGAVPSQEGS
jgi:hypothetical protein